MEPYLTAISNGFSTTYPRRREATYLIESFECTISSIHLNKWLEIVEHGMFYDLGNPGRVGDVFYLTPISNFVPWLLAGLREAVMKELTYDLLKIIATVKQAGFRSDELDVIEQSIIYR